MGISTHVIGFKPPDEEWKKHKAVWEACEAAEVHIPDDTLEFFGHEPPDDAGVEVDLPMTEYNSEAAEGYEVKVADIPEHVTVIRFLNSW